MLRQSRAMTVLGFVVASGLALAPAGPAGAMAGLSTPVGPVLLPQHGSDPVVPYVSLDFSNAQLYASDASLPDDGVGPGGEAIWRAAVEGTSTPTFSAQTLMSERVGWWLPFFRTPFSFSAARGAVVASGASPFNEPYQWRLLDRGVVTRTLSIPRPEGFSDKENHPETSGPYTLVRGQVFRADGTLMFPLPGDTPTAATSWGDLYGTGLIWSERDFESRRIWYRDVAKPQSPTNPILLDSCTCTDVGSSVSIWGDTLAWFTADSQHIAVRRLGSAAIRLVPVDNALSMSLGEGTLAWGGGWALDLTSAKSKPVQLAGMFPQEEPKLDNHLMAAIFNGQVRVARLPFGRKYRPRLLGVLAPPTFSPDGAWSPHFDTTKALKNVRLHITSATGRTVRTLSGTARDGSIRDLTWNGRTYGDRVLPSGTYHWRLTARASDGEGSLIGVDGGQVRGTVELSPPLVQPSG